LKHNKFLAKVLCGLLAVMMLVSALPLSFSVAAASGDSFTSASLAIVTEKNSTLAPGVTQDAYTLYNNKNEQVKMFVTKADMSVDTVKLYASYKDMDPTNYGMSKLTEQVASFNEKVAAGDEYYEGTVVAGINASYYNMINGKPTGTFVMNGIDVTTESEGNAYGYFAVMKDGSVKIGNKGDYSNDKGNIQEAIGIYTMLIVDGQICSGLDTSKYYPRQTIGITADGDVILMTADGNQAPKSIGLTVLEQAQVMKDLGCVWAGHLDGGGSCTYAAKAEGSNDFAIVNSPSDGSERSVSNGFIIASTVVADGKFKSASLTTENEYVTPNSTVAVSATGVDSAGGPAEIPADVEWQLADSSLGTVADGVFTSTGKTGAAVVQMIYGGEVVGETTINVVHPDAVAFEQENMTIPFGKSVLFNISATYGVKNVAIKPSDFTFTFDNSAVGTMDGFTFTACDESEAVTSSKVEAKYNGTGITALSNINLGKGSEVIYDFEDGTNQKVIIDETPGTKYNYVWPESTNFVADAESGHVHSGNYALGSELNFGNSLESGYMKSSVYATETRVFKNAVRVGCWIYIPDEFVGLWARWTLREVTGFNEDGTPIWNTKATINGNNMDTGAGGTGVVYTFDEPGWHYLYVDTSAYSAVGWVENGAMMQLYISDRDGSAYNYLAAEQSNIPGKYTVYIDDITVDYSTAVDDREAPVFGNMTYAVAGMPDAAVLNNQTVTSNKVTFAATVADYTGKSNFTGIDASTVKAYIDGVEVDSEYANGIVSVSDYALTNGKHVVKFAAEDKMGNYGYKYGYITVNAEDSASTVKLVAADPDADRILLGSIYNMNLVATAIEEVDTVNVTIDLDNNSVWQLDHMTPAEGFDVSYTLETEDNIATITVTRTGENTQTGEAVLVTIPVRTWELKTGYTYPNGTKQGVQAFTYAQYKSMGEFWRMSVIANVDKGVLTRVDGTVDSFTGEGVFCDTEMWANKANMTGTAAGLAYFNAWNGGHVHTAEAVADIAATCTTDGLTGKTFCKVCNSVVDWGTVVEAGHDYAFVDGVLKCTVDGDLFNGVYTDGKTYIDGVIANGWTEDFAYYKDGAKVTGVQEIDGFYYDFGENGVCPNKAKLDGFYFDEAEGAYMYFTAGLKATGDVAIYPTVYFFDENGYAITGEVNVNGYDCIFDEKGAFVSADDASVVDAGFAGTNIEYVLLSDGTLKVGGEGVMKDYTANGLYPAWVIKNDTTTIKAIEIGNGITHIGKFGFFKNGYVRTLTFEENSSLKSIGWGGFGHCWRLGEVTIPASVEVLEEYAFYECGALTDVKFEEGSKLHTIKEYAFMHDIGLEKVFIPDTVQTMGVGVFIKAKADVVLQVVENSVAHKYAIANNHNVELREGYVPPVASGDVTTTITWTLQADGTLEITGSGAMTNYTNYAQQPWANYRHLIKKVVISKDITAVGNYAFAYSQNIESVVFEEGSVLESVGVLAFMNVPKVTEFILPETVTYIGSYAFADCFALTNVYVPQGMEYIYATAFNNSTLAVLNVSEGTYAHEFAVAQKLNYEVRDFVYVAIDGGKLNDTVAWEFFENGELRITGEGAMPNFTSHAQQPWNDFRHKLKKIVIGKDITTVGNYAFCYAQNVTEVVFEEGNAATSIGVLSFFNVPKVATITLPDTVTSISAYAFGDCFALADVYVPQGVEFIYNTAFTNSTKVVLNVAEGTYAQEYAETYGVSYEVREFIYVAIDGGKLNDTVNWEFFENGELRITGEGAMPNFTSHAQQPWNNFRHKLKRVVIGKDITAVGNYAFCYAQNVTEVVFEEGSKATSIGVLSFFNVPKVTAITLPDTVTSISAYAFGDCFALTDVYVPQGVSFIYNTAFTNSKLVVLNVAEGTYAQEYAETYGVNYKTRDFIYVAIDGGKLNDTVSWEFYENGELRITGEGAMPNFTSHNQQPWMNFRHKFKKLVVGKDITAIGNYTFAYCNSIESIVFEEGSKLTDIGVLAFMNNAKVSEITLPETVKYIGSYAFGDCYKLTNVYVPAGTDNIYSTAFTNSKSVVLNVAAGSVAEKFAEAYNVNYITR